MWWNQVQSELKRGGNLLIRALGADGAVRCIAVDATGVVRQTIQTHELSGGLAWFAGEALVANYLLSGHIKGEEQISLQVRLQAPEVHYFGQVTSDGICRARVAPADASIPIGSPLQGIFQAVKSVVRKELYRGASLLDEESLQQALSRYMASSAQIPAYLRLGAIMDTAGQVSFAGGLIVERLAEEAGMPFLDDEAFAKRYERIEGSDLEGIVREVADGSLFGEPVQQIWQKPLVWQCRCSAQRTEAALTVFGRSAVREMLDEDGQAEVICDYCGHPWVIPGERLQAILEALPG